MPVAAGDGVITGPVEAFRDTVVAMAEWQALLGVSGAGDPPAAAAALTYRYNEKFTTEPARWAVIEVPQDLVYNAVTAWVSSGTLPLRVHFATSEALDVDRIHEFANLLEAWILAMGGKFLEEGGLAATRVVLVDIVPALDDEEHTRGKYLSAFLRIDFGLNR